MARIRGGNKRSSREIFKRRLFVVRRLIRGPATTATLIADARRAYGDEIYPLDASTALRHDLSALRNEFGCEINYAAQAGYTLATPGDLALLDLPEPELEALAFLGVVFADLHLPNAAEIESLLERIVALLPEERRAQLQRKPQRIWLDGPRRGSRARPKLLRAIKRAVGRQMIEFQYRSSYATPGGVVVHRVAPYRLLVRDGHTYLEAFCQTSDGQLNERYMLYRVDRIVAETLQPLPDQLPPAAPGRRTYRLRYLLAPAVAGQRDVALWFHDSQVEFQSDGSALISALTTDLWQARQVLLRYREHCRVIEPPELIDLLAESIERMRQIYSKAVNEPLPGA